MSSAGRDYDEDEDDFLVRPFLGNNLGTSASAARDEDNADVRPYFITGGRTEADERVQFESIVVQTRRVPPGSLGREHHLAYDASETPLSVAELSTKLRIAIGVARVLVSDLVEGGHLLLSTTARQPATDADLIRRVIDGVRALRYATAGDSV